MLSRGRDRVVVVAHADDLRHARAERVEALDAPSARTAACATLGRRAGRPGRGRTSRRPGTTQTESSDDFEELDRRRDELVRDRVLFEHLQVGLDDEAAVEPGERRAESERLDEHRHAARRSPARHGEVDPRVVERVHGLDGAGA